MMGFLFGWTYFLVIQTGTIAAVAVAFAKFTGVFIPLFGPDQFVADLGFLRNHHSANTRHCGNHYANLYQYSGSEIWKMDTDLFKRNKDSCLVWTYSNRNICKQQ
jgi:amino acid transporter